MMFLLDMRLEFTVEELDLVNKYNLADLVVYDSADRTAYQEAAYQRFDDASEVSVFNPTLNDIAASLWNNTCGIANGLMMAYALRITFSDLVAGQHVESEDLDQILVTEQTIVKACELLAERLETALSFDGSDDLREI